MLDPTTATMGAPAIGWVGLDAPLELIEAAGFRPARLTADTTGPRLDPGAIGEGGGHPWMRAMFGQLTRNAPELDRVILCAMPANELWLHNLLLSLTLRGENAGLPRSLLVNVSHEGRPSAHRLNVGALRDLADQLGATAPAVSEAISARNRVRRRLRRIDEARFAQPYGPSGVASRTLMDAADNLRSDDYLAWLDSQSSPEAVTGLPVLFSSPVVPSTKLYAALEGRGLRIVGDDTDAGSRAIGPDTDEDGDPFEALARRYAARPPAAAGWTTRERVGYLIGMARARGARAVLFDVPVWTHPAGWDLPEERKALEASGVACVLLSHAGADQAAEAAAEALGSLIPAEATHG